MCFASKVRDEQIRDACFHLESWHVLSALLVCEFMAIRGHCSMSCLISRYLTKKIREKSLKIEQKWSCWVLLVPKKKSRCTTTPSSIMFHQIIRLREETERMLEEQRQKEAQRVQRIWQKAGTYQQRRTSNRSQQVIQPDKELAYFISFQLSFRRLLLLKRTVAVQPPSVNFSAGRSNKQ